MKRIAILFWLSIILPPIFPRIASGQLFQPGGTSFQIWGGVNSPLGEMGNWFKSTYNIQGGVTKGINNFLAMEYNVTYTKFDDEGKGSSGPHILAMPEDLDLYFRSVGATANLMVSLPLTNEEGQSLGTRPYLSIGAGLYRWDAKRGGAVIENTPIASKIRAEWAYGFNAGAGLAVALGNKAYLDVNAGWEGIMDTLWQTYWLGLERVQPIQFFAVRAGLRFVL